MTKTFGRTRYRRPIVMLVGVMLMTAVPNAAPAQPPESSTVPGWSAFADGVRDLRRDGSVNRLETLDVSQIGGRAGQSYYEDAHDLRDGVLRIVVAGRNVGVPNRLDTAAT